MEKCIAILFLALTACGGVTEKEIELEQVTPTVMVNDEYYYSTEKESEIYGRCGVMDGEITSTVEKTELPSQNNQSNFGTGYGYQYANNGIEVNIDGKWIVFEKQNEEETN